MSAAIQIDMWPRSRREDVALPCGCVQVVRFTSEGHRLGRRLATCGVGGVHDGMRWPPFGLVLDATLRGAS